MQRENPNFGLSSYDNLPIASLNVFALFTRDNWDE